MNGSKLIILVAIVVVVTGVGAFLMMRGSVPSVSDSPEEMMENAVMGSGSMYCEYTDEEGRKVVAYVKDGKIRTDYGTDTQEAASMIMKDETVWTWNAQTKEGYTMMVPESVEGEAESEESVGDLTYNKDEVQQEIEKYKDSCRQESIDDSMFNPPVDVMFRDMNSMMPNGDNPSMGMPAIPPEGLPEGVYPEVTEMIVQPQ